MVAAHRRCGRRASSPPARLDSRDDYLGDKDPKRFELGPTPRADRVAAVDIDVSPSGAGLPAGSGTRRAGRRGIRGELRGVSRRERRGQAARIRNSSAARRGTSTSRRDFKIPRTIGNYWPYATTLFDYIRRAMPLTAPGSLTADQTYAVTAYLLSREGVIPATAHARRTVARRDPDAGQSALRRRRPPRLDGRKKHPLARRRHPRPA